MIKIVGQSNQGKKTLFMVLSKTDIKRLKKDKPTLVSGAEFGVDDVDIVIAYIETESQAIRKLHEMGVPADKLGPLVR